MTSVLVRGQQQLPRSVERRRGVRPSRAGRLGVGLVMVVALTYFLLPAYWLVVASTKTRSDLFTTPGLWFAEINLVENVVALSSYDGGIYWRWLLNSVVYSGVGAVLITLVSLVAGYALAMYRFRGRAVLIGAVFGSMLVPATVLAQPTYVMLAQLGLLDTYWAVLLPQLAYPFGVMLAFVFTQSAVPVEIVEAARIDGAGELRIFTAISSRLLSTGGVTILLFAFAGTWNNYLLPLLVLNDIDLAPVTVGLSGWLAASTTIPQLQSFIVVGALISVVPIVLVFLALQRFWRSGLSAGGVRG